MSEKLYSYKRYQVEISQKSEEYRAAERVTGTLLLCCWLVQQ